MNISHSPAIAITFRCNCSQPLHARTIGFLADWISAYVFIKGNKERLVLYFLVSFLGTFLTIFLVLSIRLYVQKRRAIRLLKETAPLVSPISDISYEVHRDTTLDPLDISVPTSQTTLNHGHHQHQHSLHHHHHHHPSNRLPSTLTSVVTGTAGGSGGGGHTQTHLDSQYQPLLTSPRHHHHHHHRSSSRQNSPQTSHSVSQSPQQSPQRLSLLQPDSSQLNSSSSPQPNTSINSSNNTNGNNNNLIVHVNSSNDNSPVNNNVGNLIAPNTLDNESQRLYASVPSSSQRRNTRESSSPRTTINSTPSTDPDNSPRSISIGSNNQPNQQANSIPIRQQQQQSNEMIIGYS